tara:strand:- start:768 stop:1091 length:324 start_codon:yes stop_codon:yes gene_type:complete
MVTCCTTIINVGKSRVAINTTKQQGTTISVNGMEKGTTPLQLKLKADDIITFEKDGFETRTVVVDSKFNTIAVLNLFSILGLGIDAITGSLYIPDSKVINETLKESK